MRTAIIAQARMGSSRLPGKVLKRLGDRTVLAHVVRRAQAVREADLVCVATSTLAADDAIAVEAERVGALVFRGDETDVLSRYIGAAKALDATEIMRITCDCPLLDPEVCDAVLRLRRETEADYASNVGNADWPHGLDCEAFTRQALELSGHEAKSEDEREHVTLWMRRNERLRKADLAGPGAPASEQRWTLDYPEDFEFLEALCRQIPETSDQQHWRKVLSVLDAHPELEAINRNRRADNNVRRGVPAH